MLMLWRTCRWMNLEILNERKYFIWNLPLVWKYPYGERHSYILDVMRSIFRSHIYLMIYRIQSINSFVQCARILLFHYIRLYNRCRIESILIHEFVTHLVGTHICRVYSFYHLILLVGAINSILQKKTSEISNHWQK